MQTLLASMLRTFGVGDVLVCGGAKEAINLLTITQARRKANDIRGIDMILTDWLMPDGSGVELIEWVRNHKEDDIKFLPIILVSGYTTEKVVKTARDKGANESLVKPISGEKLAHRIISVIDKPRPFIKTATFFGPDRRRKTENFKGNDKRKIKSEEIKVYHEQQ
ncbi:MAG: response regulator [Alphaproteobacteria bacterium]|nr:response regulator [Alphaproteobacteria bacterium]